MGQSVGQVSQWVSQWVSGCVDVSVSKVSQWVSQWVSGRVDVSVSKRVDGYQCWCWWVCTMLVLPGRDPGITSKVLPALAPVPFSLSTAFSLPSRLSERIAPL